MTVLQRVSEPATGMVVALKGRRGPAPGASSARKVKPVDVEVGARIRDRRRALRLSQTLLADALGITFQQVQKYERGANRISASTLVQISRFLKISTSSLLGEHNDSSNGELDVSALLNIDGAPEILLEYSKLIRPESRELALGLLRSLSNASINGPAYNI